MERRWIGPALVAFFLLCNPLSAQTLIIIPGEDPNAPPDESEGEANWNPVVTCQVGPGGSIADLLNCLAAELENPLPACPTAEGGGGSGGGPIEFDEDPPECAIYPYGRSDFTVEVLLKPPHPDFGLDVRRLDGSVIERFAFRESGLGIQTTRVHIPRSDLMAIYEAIDETPTGQGAIYLTVDSNLITVATANRTATQINKLLQLGLQDLGYILTFEGTKVSIHNHQGLMSGIRTIQWRSTDPGIRKSSLELRPDTDILPVLEE
jgi:hypothetical protein